MYVNPFLRSELRPLSNLTRLSSSSFIRKSAVPDYVAQRCPWGDPMDTVDVADVASLGLGRRFGAKAVSPFPSRSGRDGNSATALHSVHRRSRSSCIA